MAYLTADLDELFTSEIIEGLNNADIWTTNDLCSSDMMEIRRSTGIKYNVLIRLQERVKQRYTVPCHEFNYLHESIKSQSKMCLTSLPELCSALGGGFQTQEIVEFFGDSECGKTELCYLLCGVFLTQFTDYNILYIASNFDINYQKIAKYVQLRIPTKRLNEEDIFRQLSRIQVARPTNIDEFVHLLNTLVHSDIKCTTKCIIIDSLSFIVQQDILEIKTSNLNDPDETEKFNALYGNSSNQQETCTTVESKRKDFTYTCLHEIMRMLSSISITKNAIIAITNSDKNIASTKSWTNAIDHRILLSKMPEYSSYIVNNPESTIRKATILKTIHATSEIGSSFAISISDEGLFVLRERVEEENT